MVTLTILRDNREQQPWDFEKLPVETTDETINTGDYTLAEFCDHDDDLDTYYPTFAIERKSGSDFISSVGSSRDRFEEEVRRASDFDAPLLVLVEALREPSRYQSSDLFEYTSMTPSQVWGTVDAWEKHYNVSFRFAGSRSKAQRIAYDTLLTRLRTKLIS